VAKYTGKDMVVKFLGTSVAGFGRNLSVSQTAGEIDVSTYGSVDKEFLAGPVDRSATLEILDDEASSTVRAQFAPGTSGTLQWFPVGTAAGKPKFTVGTAVVTEANLTYPYDDAVLISVSLRLSGSVSEGTAP
jgi:predicted secreted protein